MLWILNHDLTADKMNLKRKNYGAKMNFVYCEVDDSKRHSATDGYEGALQAGFQIIQAPAACPAPAARSILISNPNISSLIFSFKIIIAQWLQQFSEGYHFFLKYHL